MKERGVSQRVNRITSIDLEKPSLLSTISYVSELLNQYNNKTDIVSLIKSQKMIKYKELIKELTPVVGQFQILKTAHNEVIKNLQKFDKEIETCIEKTNFAVKLGKNINSDLVSIKYIKPYK